jgi:hypothetical protein
MRILLILFLGLNLAFSGNSQELPRQYMLLTNQADSLFMKGEYQKAVNTYITAFIANGDLAKAGHRYKAASCYSLLNKADSAFIQLEKIATKGNFSNVDLITTDANFSNLYNHPKWLPLIDRIKQNKAKKEEQLMQYGQP